MLTPEQQIETLRACLAASRERLVEQVGKPTADAELELQRWDSDAGADRPGA
jgi:hypothetical protein